MTEKENKEIIDKLFTYIEEKKKGIKKQLNLQKPIIFIHKKHLIDWQ